MLPAAALLLGGHELTEVPLSQLSEQISYVSQDNYLFNRSIRENIRMGKPWRIPMKKLKKQQSEAAVTALFVGWIKVMETIAGSSGSQLSWR